MDVAPFPTVSISPTPGSYPMRLKRAGATCYPANGRCYVLGGRNGVDGEDTTLQWIWEYAPGEPGRWTQKNALLDDSLVGSRSTANMAVAVLTDTGGPRIYAIGGSDISSFPAQTVRVYDPRADAVTVLEREPWPASPVRIPGGYAVYDNKLYIFGGFSALGAGGVFTDTWVFDPMAPVGQKWTQLPGADLNLGRGYIAGAVLDGYLYAIGGDTWDPVNHTLVPMPDVERMDLNAANPTWTPVASLPTARGDMGAWAYDTGTGYSISGHVLVAGGHYDVPDDASYVYDPVANAWTDSPNFVHATRNYGVGQLNGYLYAFGGYDYSNNIPSGANFNQRYNANLIATPTGTPTSTPIRTDTPTNTRVPTSTFTPTATVTRTYTPPPTGTPPPSNTHTHTFTATPTSTRPTSTATPTPACSPAWLIASSPNPSSIYDHLFGVAAVSGTDAWAVGFYGVGNRGQTLTLHWNGSQWTHIPSPSVGTSDDSLSDVEAISSNDVWAVGYTHNSGGPWLTLVEHWDGVQWTVVPSPNPRPVENYLNAVSTVSTNDVWAVGYYSNLGTGYRTLSSFR